MNLSSVKTMNYEQITMNNANKTKPNQTQFPSKKRAFLQISSNFLRNFALPILTLAHLRENLTHLRTNLRFWFENLRV